ncbi:hypothetical protein PFISCL1PPCAC_1486, partial [Pristionchus fissidentatus]
LLLLLSSAVNAKVMEFHDTPLSCRSLQCPGESSCMEMPEGAFCWPVFTEQTQVQASQDSFPPDIELPLDRPPKPTCSSINCAPDEQCVNTFDGPTCRRVVFDLSTKFITTTPRPWSPEPVESPRSITVFAEREPSAIFETQSADSASFRSHPKDLHLTESKAVENAEMPPTSFRRPSAPKSCDTVKCPPGERCEMRDVKCLTGSCPRVPFCI